MDFKEEDDELVGFRILAGGSRRSGKLYCLLNEMYYGIYNYRDGGFDPEKKYAAWWVGGSGHIKASIASMIPPEYRDKVEMIDKPGISGWVFRPNETKEKDDK